MAAMVASSSAGWEKFSMVTVVFRMMSDRTF
jgi:hypothetical protein